MNNIVKGWATTIIGLAMIAVSLLHFYGFLPLPEIEGISAETQLAVGFTVGLILFLLPGGIIEASLTKILQGLVNLFNKKTE